MSGRADVEPREGFPGADGRSVDEVNVELSSDSRAAGQARGVVRTTLRRWRLPGLLDAITLVVSELVTNAVRYGIPPVRMVLSRRTREVRVAVYDDEPDEPGPVSLPGDDAESGRGMAIVGAISRANGVEQIPGDGKAMYASFDVPSRSPD